LLRDGRRDGVLRGRRPAARRGAADQGRGRLRGRSRARRTLRRAFRSDAPRRSGGARRPPQSAVVHRLRHAAADGGSRSGRRDRRCRDCVSARPRLADARVLGGDETPQVVKAALVAALALLAHLCASATLAQDAPAPPRVSRLAVLQAEDRRAPTPRDLSVIRSGLHTGEESTVRSAVRALGRLERPSLIPDIIPSLRHALPEIRVEAANAIGQAAQGWKADKPPPPSAVDGASAPLVARL